MVSGSFNKMLSLREESDVCCLFELSARSMTTRLRQADALNLAS